MSSTLFSENFVSFCKKANLPITELPTKDKPMGMTYEIAMKEYDPYLYQRLTTQKPLRADVAVRHKTGNYWIEDVKELDAVTVNVFWVLLTIVNVSSTALPVETSK